MGDFWNNNVKGEKIETKERFTFRKFKRMGFHVWRQFDDPYYTGFAAQIAYFFFMSSIPILIVLTQVLGIFDVSVDFIRDWLEEHLSTQMSSILTSLFGASSTALSNVFMIILALWGASSLEFSLARLTTYTLTGGKYRFNFFTERAKAIPMAVMYILVVAVALGFYVYGDTIASEFFKDTFVAQLIGALRTPVLTLLFFIVVLASYYIIPRIKVPLAAVMPGAVVATLGIMIVTWLYSLYTANAMDYNVLYGTFSNIVAMLLWFYFISWVLCIGMMFNKSWDIYMNRKRLVKEKLHSYVISLYGEKRGEEVWKKTYINEEDVFDPGLDTIAVKFSKKFDSGFAEKHERELEELRKKMVLQEWIEKERQDDEERR